MTGTASARIVHFGTMPDGRPVQSVHLDSGCGLSAVILTYGARLQALTVPDAVSHRADVVLGYDRLEDYLQDEAYMGATIGRFANRIADARFQLDGRIFAVTANDRGNCLHGGTEGFDSRVWMIDHVEAGAHAMVAMSLESPDGEGGFPGAVSARASYTLDGDGRLIVECEARTDRPTIIGLTHHSYWNLAGHDSGRDVREHELTILADRYLPIRADGIPTGDVAPVVDTVFDFNTPVNLLRAAPGEDGQLGMAGGYDHCWMLPDGPSVHPRLVATVRDPVSRRAFDLWTNQPALQVYGGNVLSGRPRGKGGCVYRRHSGLALEPQRAPDTPSRRGFGSARLNPGEVYNNRSIWHFHCN